MLSSAAWISALATILALIASALWAERRYSGYIKFRVIWTQLFVLRLVGRWARGAA